MEDNKVTTDNVQYNVYLSERDSLFKASADSAKQFDKAILTLSAGAFAISITFINKIAPSPQPWSIYILIMSWVCLVVSLLAVLISLMTSQNACLKQIDILEYEYFDKDDKTKKAPTNKLSSWTSRLNILSITAFILGIFFLASFSIANLNYKKEVIMSEKKTPSSPNPNKGFVPPKIPAKPNKSNPGSGYAPPRTPVKPPSKPSK